MRTMPFAAGLSLAALAGPADAACRFSPFRFFPDRNDKVTIRVVTQAGEQCQMAFSEGPGYRFTGASFLKPPPHGVLAQTGPTSFMYIAFDKYRGPDRYAVKLCADVQGRRGCSSLYYDVTVE